MAKVESTTAPMILPVVKMVPLEKPLTPHELHELSGFSTKLIYQWLKRDFDSLPCVQSGKRSFIYADDFNKFIQREKVRR